MKKMRNWGIVLLAFVLGCIIIHAALPSREDKIVAFVRENEIELTAIAEKRLAGDYAVKNYKNAKVDGVFPNTAKGDIVQFYYAGEGIAPASKYYGFYYSVDDKPTAFQNVNAKLEQDADAWRWNQAGSDNGGIVKRIGNGWYYYEAWF